MKEEYTADVYELTKRKVFASVQAESLEEAKALFQAGKYVTRGGESGQFYAVDQVSNIKTPEEIKADSDEWDKYWEQMCAYKDEVEAEIERLGHTDRVCYSVDEPPGSEAIRGKCILHHQGWGEEHVTSEVMESPTWMQVALFANEAIALSGDGHHIYLEGVYKRGEPEAGVQRYELCMGS